MRTRVLRTAPVAALVVLAAAACGSAGTAGAGGSATATSSGAAPVGASTTPLKVGSAPVLSNASLYQAIQDGTFAKNHLAVTPQTVTAGAQAVPLLLNGQLQFSAADSLGAIQALSKKIPLQIVAQASVVSPDPAKDSSGLLVKPDSPLKSAADLSGKTIAVNALGGAAQLAAQASIDAAGGRSSSIKFVEIPSPQIVAAVQGGQVDGGVTLEPFIAQGRAAGLKGLLAVTSASLPDVPFVIYVTSKAYATSHPDVVKAFASSIDTANATLARDPDQVRRIGATSTSVGPDVLRKVVLPVFPTTPLDVRSLDTLQNLMTKYKYLPQALPLANFVAGS